MITKQIYDKEDGWIDTTVFEQFEIKALQLAGLSDVDIELLCTEYCTQEEIDKRFGKYTFNTFDERKNQAKEQLEEFWRRDTENQLKDLIRSNKALYWVETSATLTSVFKKCGAVPVKCDMVKYLLNEQVTPSQDGYRYMHPEQEAAHLSAWKTLFVLPSLEVYDTAYKRIGDKSSYEITNAKDAGKEISRLYGLTGEDQVYEIFPQWENAVNKASWFLKDENDRSIDCYRKAKLLNDADYYLDGYSVLIIHPIPKVYLNTIEDEYGVILDESMKRIVDINKESFVKHQSYMVPSTVEFIDDDIFCRYENLKHIDLGNVRMIGCNQFLQTGIEELVVPATVESLDGCVCEGCKSLKKVEFLGRLYYLGIASFNGCSSLTEVKLPKDLIELSDNVFSGTVSLESLTLEEGLRFIGGECFMGSGIKSLDIPMSVIEIAADAYLGREDIGIKLHCPNFKNMPISMLKDRPMPAWFYIERFQEQWIIQLLRYFTYVVLAKSTGTRQHMFEYYKHELKNVLKWINAVEIEVAFPYYTLTTALTTKDTGCYDIVYLYLSVLNSLDLEDWVTTPQNKLAVAFDFKSRLSEMYSLVEYGTADEIDGFVESLDRFKESGSDLIRFFVAQCDEHLVSTPIDPKLLHKKERGIDETMRQMKRECCPVTFPLTHAWPKGPSMTSTVGFIEALIKDFRESS